MEVPGDGNHRGSGKPTTWRVSRSSRPSAPVYRRYVSIRRPPRRWTGIWSMMVLTDRQWRTFDAAGHPEVMRDDPGGPRRWRKRTQNLRGPVTVESALKNARTTSRVGGGSGGRRHPGRGIETMESLITNGHLAGSGFISADRPPVGGTDPGHSQDEQLVENSSQWPTRPTPRL